MLAFFLTRKLTFLFTVIIVILLLGSWGYVYLESYTWTEAFYMTVITVTTVGYGEVKALSPTGQLFTCFLIFIGVSYIALGVQTLTLSLMEHFLNKKNPRMQKNIDKLHGHYIICGLGRVGISAAEHLNEQGGKIVIVDRKADEALFSLDLDYPYVKGDATEDEMLIRAGIHRAKGVMCVLPSDPDNMYVILTCRELNPSLHIVTRTSNKNNKKRFLRAGANEVISPYRIAGIEIASYLMAATTSK